MKIIKEGIAPQNREYAHTCNVCGTEFSFKQFEASKVQTRTDVRLLLVYCPLRGCGTAHQVPEKPLVPEQQESVRAFRGIAE